MTIGVLALQGDFHEHRVMIENIEGHEVTEVRTIEDLNQVQGLIIPGGESTTIGKLLKKTGLDQAIIERAKSGMPVYGTCAGAIIVAKSITGAQQAHHLALIDIEIQRNAYGRQLDSFITDLEVDPKVSDRPVKSVFIRAPIITQIGVNVQVLAKYEEDPVLVQEGNILVSSFHPELTKDDSIHRYFLKIVAAQ